MNPNLKPQGGRSFAVSLLHGFAIRSATGQNRPTDRQAAQKRNGATKSEGLDVGKYFWRSGGERCFSLDIPYIGLLARNSFRFASDAGRTAGESMGNL
jgi:hypothetical protein